MSLETRRRFTRRRFLAASGKLLVGTVTLASIGTRASDEHEHQHGGVGDGLFVDAAAEDTCVTCRFWGGMRKLSDGGSQVIAQSMGWCNNPGSPNYRKLTTADHRMRKADVWKKWAVL